MLKLQYFGHLTYRKRPRCWEKLKAGEGNNRGWDGWMASLTRWIWVWASSMSWWWTRKPDELQSMGSQRVGRDLVTELTDWPAERVWNYHPTRCSLVHLGARGLNLRGVFLGLKIFWNCFVKFRPAWDTPSIPSFWFLSWFWNVFPMPVPPLYYGTT